jgi:hypothetical protein
MERIFPMDSTVTLIIAFPAPTPEADSVGIDETQVFTRSARLPDFPEDMTVIGRKRNDSLRAKNSKSCHS